MPEPVFVTTAGTPNWQVAGWLHADVRLTDDHLTVMARAVERVRDVADWDGT